MGAGHFFAEPDPHKLSGVGLLDSGDTTSRRGGSGADAGLGPLWPPVADEAHPWSSTQQARRAATRAPTPLHAAPAPTRCPSPWQKPPPESLVGVRPAKM